MCIMCSNPLPPIITPSIHFNRPPIMMSSILSFFQNPMISQVINIGRVVEKSKDGVTNHTSILGSL